MRTNTYVRTYTHKRTYLQAYVHTHLNVFSVQPCTYDKHSDRSFYKLKQRTMDLTTKYVHECHYKMHEREL